MKQLLAVGALALTFASGVAYAAPADPADPSVGLFAQNAALANAYELEEAKIILEDSTNPALRHFAEIMTRDHGTAQRELRSAGAIAGVPTDFVLDGVRQKEVDDIGLMEGVTLDKTYVADQTAAHAAAVASLGDYAVNGADPAFRAYARATLPIVLAHQRMLEELTGTPATM